MWASKPTLAEDKDLISLLSQTEPCWGNQPGQLCTEPTNVKSHYLTNPQRCCKTCSLFFADAKNKSHGNLPNSIPTYDLGFPMRRRRKNKQAEPLVSVKQSARIMSTSRQTPANSPEQLNSASIKQEIFFFFFLQFQVLMLQGRELFENKTRLNNDSSHRST